MLPSNLLRARISRGKISPVYVGIDPDALALAESISRIYRDGVGKRKGELLDRLNDVENQGHDFKLGRGRATLLERRCVFEAESAMDPVAARKAVFREASRTRASSAEEKSRVLQKVSTELALSPEVLEETLFSDAEDELVLKQFTPLSEGPE